MIDVTDSLTQRSLTFSAIIPLFVDRFGRSVRICHLEFDKEAMVVEVKMPSIGAKGF